MSDARDQLIDRLFRQLAATLDLSETCDRVQILEDADARIVDMQRQLPEFHPVLPGDPADDD